MSLLTVERLRVGFAAEDGKDVTVVDGVSFTVGEAEGFGLVGESGCGKSVTVYAVLGLLPSPPGRVLGGRGVFRGRDLLAMDRRELRKVLGKEIGMVFQEPSTFLNPVLTVGEQIVEPMFAHGVVGSAKEARERAVELVRRVGIPFPERRFRAYPHELSGGMRQRAMIAMALACGPALLVADEPTTALDVTVQAQIMDLLEELRAERRMSLLLITHNLGLVAESTERLVVMYAGKVVESGPTREVLRSPLHPYTQGLLKAVPGLDGLGRRLYAIPGVVPSPSAMPPGCRFAPRCPYAMPRCREGDPAWVEAEPGRGVACVLYGGP